MLTFIIPTLCNTRTPPTRPVPTRVRILSPALPITMVRTVIRKIILLAILMQASHLIAAILPAPAATRSKTRTRTVLRNHLQAMTTSRAVNQAARMTSSQARNLQLLNHQPNPQLLSPAPKAARLGSN